MRGNRSRPSSATTSATSASPSNVSRAAEFRPSNACRTPPLQQLLRPQSADTKAWVSHPAGLSDLFCARIRQQTETRQPWEIAPGHHTGARMQPSLSARPPPTGPFLGTLRSTSTAPESGLKPGLAQQRRLPSRSVRGALAGERSSCAPCWPGQNEDQRRAPGVPHGVVEGVQLAAVRQGLNQFQDRFVRQAVRGRCGLFSPISTNTPYRSLTRPPAFDRVIGRGAPPAVRA